MMKRNPIGDQAVCFLCDCGLILLAVLLVLAVAALRQTAVPAAPHLPTASTPSSTPLLTPTGVVVCNWGQKNLPKGRLF